MPAKYDAVIFDLFGTLVDNPEVPGPIQAASDQYLADLAAAISVPTEQLLRLWRETADERMKGHFPTPEGYITHLCQELGVDPGADQVIQAAGIRLDFLREHLVPRPDSKATMSQLKSSGYKIGLISDCSPETSLTWPSISLAPLVDAAILSSEVGMKKPDPRIYKLACTRLGVASDRCLYVGDGSSDELAGAARVGMTPIRIRVPYEIWPNDPFPWSGPEISAVSQVLEHLE